MVSVGLERANLALLSFLLLIEIAGGIAGDIPILKSSVFHIVWAQYTKKYFFKGVLKKSASC